MTNLILSLSDLQYELNEDCTMRSEYTVRVRIEFTRSFRSSFIPRLKIPPRRDWKYAFDISKAMQDIASKASTYTATSR